MCGLLLPAATAMLVGFVALWFWIASPIRDLAPDDAARQRFIRRLADYGRYAVALGVLLVLVTALGAAFACQ